MLTQHEQFLIPEQNNTIVGVFFLTGYLCPWNSFHFSPGPHLEIRSVRGLAIPWLGLLAVPLGYSGIHRAEMRTERPRLRGWKARKEFRGREGRDGPFAWDRGAADTTHRIWACSAGLPAPPRRQLPESGDVPTTWDRAASSSCNRGGRRASGRQRSLPHRGGVGGWQESPKPPTGQARGVRGRNHEPVKMPPQQQREG